AFLAKVDAAGDALAYATYLGGGESDRAQGIAVDPGGNAYVTGITYSSDFPTFGAQQPSCGDFLGCEKYGDAFIAKLNSTGSAFPYSTYTGGLGVDQGFGIAVDAAGEAYTTGFTSSPDFPTQSAQQAACADSGCSQGDAFVTKLGPTGG